MTITELIHKLEDLLVEHGDVEVTIGNLEERGMDEPKAFVFEDGQLSIYNSED